LPPIIFMSNVEARRTWRISAIGGYQARYASPNTQPFQH